MNLLATEQTKEAIEATWAALCVDPALQDLPYKIETNEYGQIIMSPPTSNPHGFFAFKIGLLLNQLLASGRTGTEIGVVTRRGVKVPDLVWVSSARFKRIARETASSIAPEICVEVLSPGNSAKEIEGKRTLYFEAGASEVWFCHADGKMDFFADSGQISKSRLCPKFPTRVKP